MKKRIPHRALAGAKNNVLKALHTGEHRPKSGWWAPAENPTKGYFISEGSLMPTDDGEEEIVCGAVIGPLAQPPRSWRAFSWVVSCGSSADLFL